jgi:ferritin-like metal-binding protein YciE
MKTIYSRKDLVDEELVNVLYAEDHLSRVIPLLAELSTSGELTAQIEKLGAETIMHLKGIRYLLDYLELRCPLTVESSPQSIVGHAMETINLSSDAGIRNEAILNGIHQILNYKISTYRTLGSYAAKLQLEDVEEIINRSLKEDKQMDMMFSEISETMTFAK